jgi:hypothetical protein
MECSLDRQHGKSGIALVGNRRRRLNHFPKLASNAAQKRTPQEEHPAIIVVFLLVTLDAALSPQNNRGLVV